ncbi:MAG: DUF1614 domain-containing protein [Gammaproteobacteria bacterium]|nr:DUF1614 domain-containing protein [Gammaproteobacteria bacterium]MDH3446944.1 DUF1614 domain-containing protein [Gammaproteobacteria bacterium]
MQFLLLVTIFILCVIVLYMGVLTLALDKLGLSTHSAMLLLGCTLLGSTINMPLFQISAEAPPDEEMQKMQSWLFGRPLPFTGKTIVAINVGGALIPVTFSVYLASSNRLPPLQLLLAIAIVAAVCYLTSRPIRGLGIGMPIFVAPLAAALTATTIAPENSAPMAYICGTLGVLIGADLMRLNDIRKIGTPVASIGGAGTFDGIFLTGIVAVLLS